MWDPVVVWLKRLKRQPPPLFAWHGLTVAGEPQIVPTYVNDPEASGGMAAWNVLFFASDQATEPGGKHTLIVYTFCAEGCEGGSQNHGAAYEAPPQEPTVMLAFYSGNIQFSVQITMINHLCPMVAKMFYSYLQTNRWTAVGLVFNVCKP